MTSSPIDTNPLLEPWTGPFEAPPFDRFEPRHFPADVRLGAQTGASGDRLGRRRPDTTELQQYDRGARAQRAQPRQDC